LVLSKSKPSNHGTPPQTTTQKNQKSTNNLLVYAPLQTAGLSILLSNESGGGTDHLMKSPYQAPDGLQAHGNFGRRSNVRNRRISHRNPNKTVNNC